MTGHAAPLVDVHIAESIDCASSDMPAEQWLTDWVRRALDGLKEQRPVSVSLSVVDEEESRRLNHEYRGKDRSTNVLSFPMDFEVPPPPGEPLLLGDIVICGPVVMREATEQGKPVDAHWAHMVTHGVLHLAGHDHEDDGEAEVMEQLEKNILAGGGVADPYIAGD